MGEGGGAGAGLRIPVLLFRVAAFAQSQWFGLQKPGTPADQQPLLLKKISIQQRLNTQIPLNLEFRDETGKLVHLGDYFGKRPVILVAGVLPVQDSLPGRD